MLHPNDRSLLIEALKPPLDYRLDMALGTTFSLDLMALLTVPLSFSLLDHRASHDRANADPLALLESLRRHARHLAIFCQSGEIQVPRKDQPLLTYLERSVVEVVPPKEGGVFHPKVWVLRFTGNDIPVRYRVLCLTRNLTYDRSWDLIVGLEGDLVDRQRAISANHPLADFVASLPDLAVRQPVAEHARQIVKCMQDELRRVRFELPDNVDEISFWPIGVQEYNRWPFEGRRDRMLVVSPFLKDMCLRQLTNQGTEHVLISSQEALQAINADTLSAFQHIYTLTELEDNEPSQEEAEEQPSPEIGLSGLHAKLYVLEAGWDASVFAGSANATNAAFEKNVEFLVGLHGKKSKLGIETIMEGNGEKPCLTDLLEEYRAPTTAVEPDPDQKKLEELLEKAQQQLARMKLQARLQPGSAKDLYEVRIERLDEDSIKLPADVAICCWPITLQNDRRIAFAATEQTVASWTAIPFGSLTSFFAIELKATRGQKSLAKTFVLNIALQDAPEDREHRVLLGLLQDPAKVMRFILLLLAEDAWQVHDLGDGSKDADKHGRRPFSFFAPTLLESLVRALDKDPQKLDAIGKLISDLDTSEQGKTLLPAGLKEIWPEIWAARKKVNP